MSSTKLKIVAGLLAAVTLAGTAADASARNRYIHSGGGYHRGYGHHGIGAGGVIAGAALGIIGAGIAGAAASHYYNGYPAYNYGPGYGPAYGYDYHPGYGYYGPY